MECNETLCDHGMQWYDRISWNVMKHCAIMECNGTIMECNGKSNLMECNVMECNSTIMECNRTIMECHGM